MCGRNKIAVPRSSAKFPRVLVKLGASATELVCYSGSPSGSCRTSKWSDEDETSPEFAAACRVEDEYAEYAAISNPYEDDSLGQPVTPIPPPEPLTAPSIEPL